MTKQKSIFQKLLEKIPLIGGAFALYHAVNIQKASVQAAAVDSVFKHAKTTFNRSQETLERAQKDKSGAVEYAKNNPNNEAAQAKSKDAIQHFEHVQKAFKTVKKEYASIMEHKKQYAETGKMTPDFTDLNTAANTLINARANLSRAINPSRAVNSYTALQAQNKATELHKKCVHEERPTSPSVISLDDVLENYEVTRKDSIHESQPSASNHNEIEPTSPKGR